MIIIIITIILYNFIIILLLIILLRLLLFLLLRLLLFLLLLLLLFVIILFILIFYGLVPTYFICGKESSKATDPINEVPNGGQICKNLTYLGRSGVKEIDGLSVAYLSGGYDASNYDQPADEDRNFQFEPFYHSSDVRTLVTKAAKASPFGIDILLTSEWGAGFHNLSDEVVNKLPATIAEKPNSIGSPGVALLASRIPARYHFAGTMNTYFELLPYRLL